MASPVTPKSSRHARRKHRKRLMAMDDRSLAAHWEGTLARLSAIINKRK